VLRERPGWVSTPDRRPSLGSDTAASSNAGEDSCASLFGCWIAGFMPMCSHPGLNAI